ncbi:MAG: GTP-binding protein [Candidatus Kariarchaeaceae archaeon]
MVKATLKVIVVGNGNVGKTALSTRFTTGGFRESYVYTIGANFLIKTIDVNDKKVKLTLWDTAGQERYGRLLPKFFQNSDGAIIVYDQLDKTSFLAIDNWVDKINRFAGDIPLILVANKADLANPVVTIEEGITKAAYHSASFIETSAKNNLLVEETFFEICQRCFGKTFENLMGIHGRIEKERIVEEIVDEKILPPSKVMTMPVPTANLPIPDVKEPIPDSEVSQELKTHQEDQEDQEDQEHKARKEREKREEREYQEKQTLEASLIGIPLVPKIPEVSNIPVASNEVTVETSQLTDSSEKIDNAVIDTEDEQKDPYKDEEVPIEEPLLTEEVPIRDTLEESVENGDMDEYVEFQPEITKETDIPEVVSKEQWPQIKQRFESVSTFIEKEAQFESKLENKEEIIPKEKNVEDHQSKQLDLTNVPSPPKHESSAFITEKTTIEPRKSAPFSAVNDSPQRMRPLSDDTPTNTQKPKIDYFDPKKQPTFTSYRDEIASKVIDTIKNSIENKEETSHTEKTEEEAILDWLKITNEANESEDQSTSNEEEEPPKTVEEKTKRELPSVIVPKTLKEEDTPPKDDSEAGSY